MTEPIRKWPWQRLFAEGLVIVVSILLAFAIDAWWDGRQQRAAERAALAGLTTDFENNVVQLDWNTQTVAGQMDHLWRLTTLSDAESASVPADSVLVYLFSLWIPVTFDAQDATLDALIASGSLGLIGDAPLRDMLAEWKAHVVDLQEESAMIFDLSADVLRRMGTLGGPWQPPLPTMSGGGLPRSQPDLTRVVRDAELMSLALARREAFALQEFALRPMAALADRVLARLEELQQ